MLATASLLLAMSATVAAEDAASAVPSIEVRPTDNGLSLIASIVALSAGDFEGRMTVKKSGPSGTTSTQQGSTFTLSHGQAATVATMGLSFQPGDDLEVELSVSSGGRDLAKSTIQLGSPSRD